MKIIIVLSLLLAAALGLVTNLISNFLSLKAEKYRTQIWVLFVILIVASVVVAVWPEDSPTAEIAVLEVQATTLAPKGDGEVISAGCSQRVKLLNRGDALASVVRYTAMAQYGTSQTTATGTEIGDTVFRPAAFGSSLENLAMNIYAWTGEATMLGFPSRILPQGAIDIDVDVHFTYNKQMFNIWDIHAEQIPNTASLLTVQYIFTLADGSNVETDPVPCTFLESKTNSSPQTPTR